MSHGASWGHIFFVCLGVCMRMTSLCIGTGPNRISLGPLLSVLRRGVAAQSSIWTEQWWLMMAHKQTRPERHANKRRQCTDTQATCFNSLTKHSNVLLACIRCCNWSWQMILNMVFYQKYSTITIIVIVILLHSCWEKQQEAVYQIWGQNCC